MQQTGKKSERYKKWEIENKENCDLYIATLEERRSYMCKAIGILSVGALVFLGHAISYDNKITLILGLIQGARALLGVFGVFDVDDRIQFLIEVKEEYEKNKNIEKDTYDVTEDNGE